MNICCPSATNTALQEKAYKILSKFSPERKQTKSPNNFILFPAECQLPRTYCHSVVSLNSLAVSVSIRQLKSVEVCPAASMEDININGNINVHKHSLLLSMLLCSFAKIQ